MSEIMSQKSLKLSQKSRKKSEIVSQKIRKKSHKKKVWNSVTKKSRNKNVPAVSQKSVARPSVSLTSFASISSVTSSISSLDFLSFSHPSTAPSSSSEPSNSIGIWTNKIMHFKICYGGYSFSIWTKNIKSILLIKFAMEVIASVSEWTK